MIELVAPPNVAAPLIEAAVMDQIDALLARIDGDRK